MSSSSGVTGWRLHQLSVMLGLKWSGGHPNTLVVVIGTPVTFTCYGWRCINNHPRVQESLDDSVCLRNESVLLKKVCRAGWQCMHPDASPSKSVRAESSTGRQHG